MSKDTNVEAIYPLSPTQQGMLFHSLYAAGSGVYTVQVSFHLAGPLDTAALARSWQGLIDRHPVLRTAFPWDRGSKPMQVVLREVRAPWEERDERGLSPGAGRQSAEALCRQELRRGFELARAPLLRLVVVRREDELHQLVWSYHHLLFDGWSLPILLRELAASYGALCRGAGPELPPVRPYADHVAWLQRRDTAAAEGFWRGELAGFTAPTPLPFARAGAPVGEEPHGERVVELPAAVLAALQAWARQRRLTLNSVFQGAWALVLSVCTGEDDVVFGVTTSGRPPALEGVESMVGLFINTLPARVRVPLGAPLAAWLQDLQARQLALRRHEHTDLTQVQRWSEVARGVPLFESLLVFENFPSEDARRPWEGGVELRDLSIRDSSNYAVTVTAVVTDVLVLRALYDTSRLDAAGVDRLLAHLRRVLEGVAAAPDGRLEDLPLLSAAQEQQLLGESNGAVSPFPRAPLAELFAAQALRRPDDLAVVFGEDRLTYGGLDRRANRLARCLVTLGVRPGDFVAVCLERSAALITALLGIVKAGAAYVPLDPDHPAERLAFMLADARASVLVSSRGLRASLPAEGVETVLLDGDELEGEGDLDPAPRVPAGAPAYVMYTSGSTGLPKGIVIPQEAVARLVLETDFVRLTSADRIAQASNASFDASTFEIWGALLNGGRIVGIPREVALSPQRLTAAITEHGITTLFLTTALFNQVAQEVPAGFRPLTHLLFGGQAVDPGRVRDVLAAGPPARFLHVYGPTESTTYASWHRIAEVPPGASTVPIGRSLANTALLVLDRALRLVPTGVPGELYVGGDGLAHGYLSRPGLTAERFLPHPWRVGERLYRTGDLVRRDTRGDLEFLGRVDDQVKIRGFRVEPAEVEAVLARHPGVREVVVVARADGPGDKRLVAYVVPGAPAPETRDLRAFLAERVPEYLVPAAFVTLDALPLSPNGKVDRRALPAPERVRCGEAPYTAPRNAGEELLAGIWAGVLGLEKVGVEDDFFALGGDSILSIQIVARATRAGLRMTPRDVFEHPTVAGLAAMAAAAPEEAPLPAAIPRAPREGRLPLSSAQRRLWFLHQLDPDSPAYDISGALRIRGELPAAVLERAVGTLVDRHETLRTTFSTADGEPYQVVHASLPADLEILDLRGVEETERETRLLEIGRAEAGRIFDLERGPLFRAALVLLSAAEQVLFLTLHHIIADGWSMGILSRELMEAGVALAEGRAPDFAPLPVQYVDFAVWHDRWLADGVAEAQTAWWRSRLSGLAPLELPADRPRPVARSARGGRRSLGLPGTLREEIKALCRREKSTLFMTLLAALQALLHRYTGRDSVHVGTAVANRDRPEIEGLIGFFVNTLVLRTDLSGDPGFATFLQRVQEVSLGAFAHQDLPFETLVAALQPERRLSENPLVQVMLSVQEDPLQEIRLPRSVVTPLGVYNGTAKFDLVWEAVDTDGGLRLSAEHSTDLFDSATIDRMLGHFQVLLAAAVAAPDLRLSELPLLDAAEERQVLTAWNPPRIAGSGGDLSLAELFERQVARDPEAVAVVWDGASLTYGELDRRANRLARHLRSLGVAPGDFAALYLERSCELLVAILGILKAGAAYIPLDLDYPPARLAFMLEDTAAPVVLTREGLSPSLPESGAIPVFLDASREAIGRRSEDALPPMASGGSVACVLYTSGSTGRPKGIALPQSAVSRLVRGADYVCLGPADRIAQVSNVSFDAATFEIWGALLHGGQIVGLPKDVALAPRELAAQIRARGITTLLLTTALFHQVSREVPDAFRPLSTLLFGGQAVDPGRVREVLAAGPPGRLVHLYGPTESTTCASWFCIESVEPDAATVPIGHPLANAELYVVDRAFRPAPLGVVGELWIGGGGLALGYLRRPEATAERFVPHPWSGRPGERLYRTGDLVRRPVGGALEFVGRVDHQVKIRGFRVEPAEVEIALAAHPDLREVAVVARQDGLGEVRLVAYCAAAGRLPEAAVLRDFLRRRVPEFMIPTAFVSLDTLPLDPNGKVDRRALPAPARSEAEASCAAPRSPVESEIVRLWEELLGISPIGIHDDFFALGGHSLLITRLAFRLREACGVDLPLHTLFGAPTVEAMSRAVLESRSGREATAAIPRVSRDGRLPLSPAQQRLWFLHQLDPDSPAYNIAAALHVRGELPGAVLERALGAVVDRHEALRTTFSTAEGQPYQVIHPSLPAALEVVDLCGAGETAREARLQEIGRAEAGTIFDLERGPLFRAALVSLAKDEQVLFLTLHHIVADGWSMGILSRELMEAGVALEQGRRPDFPPLPIQYADFAAWHRRWLADGVAEAQTAWWRSRLGGVLEPLDLPADRPRPASRSKQGGQRLCRLPGPLREEVKAMCQREGVTLFMALLAAFQAMLHRLTSRESIHVGSAVANRTRPEVEGLIGFFVNTLVLRTDLSGDPGFATLLRRVQDVSLGAFAHQDLPFETLVDALQPERRLGQNPLVQVMFSFYEDPMMAARRSGITPLEVHNGTAKFDLLWEMTDTGDALRLAAEHSADLFEASTIDRMMRHFQVLLTAAVAAPDRRLSELPLLAQHEEAQLLAEWNDTGSVAAGDPRALTDLVAEQAERAPGAPAAACGGQELSYRLLVSQANQLARHLLALGVKPEERVGLCVDRSLALPLGLLGILGAGAAFVPLDPALPAERLEWILDDAGVGVVVTQSPLAPHLPLGSRRLVLLDRDAPQIARCGVAPPEVEILPGRLAWVIYTSGSTGRPKGVLVPHAGVLNLAVAQHGQLGAAAGCRVLQFSSLSFDASLFDVIMALASGGCLCLASQESVMPGPPLLEVLRRERITHLTLPPSALAVVPAADLPELRSICVAGEACPPELVERWAHGRRFFNLYGPTETTIWATTAQCHPGERRPPIGRPIPNVRVYLLDRQGRPVPQGVAGEVHLGGPGLARGYLNRPDLTAERFVPDPWSPAPGGRLYRTGDLARHRPDGTLDFAGRVDFQVKIRGFRIEPGEIEAALLRHPALREAAVVPRPDHLSALRLVAYAAPAEGEAAPSVAELRAFLAKLLPSHMVPAVFVFLPRLPIRASGKVDRGALPDPEGGGEAQAPYVAPRTPVEAEIVRLWEDLLGISPIGIHDDFFALGGHSLLITQLASRLREAFGVDLPLRTVFGAPTVVEMSRVILESQMEQEDATDLAGMLERLRDLSPEEVQRYLESGEGLAGGEGA